MGAVEVFQALGAVVKYGWPFFLLTMIVIAKLRWKNWVIDVVVLERRGKNVVKTNDRAAKYVDKFTGLTGYKLMKAGDTIPVVEFDWILHNNVKHLNILERLINILRPTAGTLFLFRYGSKQYKPIITNIDGNAKKSLESIKDKDGKDIYVYRYQQFDPRGYLNPVKMEVFDWDNMNFVVQEMRASFERRKKQGTWLKTVLMPIAIIVMAAMVSIIMMKFSLDYSQSLRVDAVGAEPQQAETPEIPIIGDVLPGQ